jgi:hypothetical protein
MGKRYNVKNRIRRGVWRNAPYNLVERSRISLATRIQSNQSTIEILINSIEDYDTKREISRINYHRQGRW